MVLPCSRQKHWRPFPTGPPAPIPRSRHAERGRADCRTRPPQANTLRLGNEAFGLKYIFRVRAGEPPLPVDLSSPDCRIDGMNCRF